jgi:hypothetical protein
LDVSYRLLHAFRDRADRIAMIYLAGAVFFMQLWAGQKYARYKREQDPKVFPGKRWKYFPPLY